MTKYKIEYINTCGEIDIVAFLSSHKFDIGTVIHNGNFEYVVKSPTFWERVRIFFKIEEDFLHLKLTNKYIKND